MSQVLAELRLRADASMLPVARACVLELCALANLTAEDGQDLSWAVEAACGDLIAHAFDPGEAPPLTITAELSPAALTVAIRERGLPFDPGRLGAAAAPPAVAAVRSRARGPLWRKIHAAVDTLDWVNHGREGMELRLRKARPEAVSLAAAAFEAAPATQAVPPAPAQRYTVRRLKPGEASGVSQVIYRTYGGSYPNDDLYYPDRIVQLNATGQLVSVVAVDARGTVVGHYAIERPNLELVAEAGQAVVSPAHRGRQLMERMHTCLEQEAQRLGLHGLYTQPVTAHTFSQRVQEDFELRPCGVSLGIWPTLDFQQLAQADFQRRSTLMLYFKYLQRPGRVQIYLPAHHRPMIERLYANLGGPVEFLPGGAPGGYGKVGVSYLKRFRLATIGVQQVGGDTAAEIRQARDDLVRAAGAEAVLLELPLAQPGTIALCEAAEAARFFFAGLRPGAAPGGDTLRLQYLAVPIESRSLQILSPLGKELLAYVEAERARVGRDPAQR